MLAEVLLYDKLILHRISIKFSHMKIGWHHFTMLMTIRNTGSLSAAARALGLTQSAATHQVKEAERRLGIVAAGPAWPLRRPHARRRDSRRRRGHLRAGAGGSGGQGAGARPWRRAAAAPRGRHPGWLAVGRRPVRRPRAARQPDPPRPHADRQGYAGGFSVHQGRADAAIELGDAAFPGLKRELIAKDELVGIVHRAHVCAARGRMIAGEIVDDPYLAHALTPQRGFEFETFFRPARQVPRYIARIELLAAIIALVADGAGVSIQPRSAIQHAVAAERIVAVPPSPAPIQLPWHLHLHPAALALHGEHLIGRDRRRSAPAFRPRDAGSPTRLRSRAAATR